MPKTNTYKQKEIITTQLWYRLGGYDAGYTRIMFVRTRRKTKYFFWRKFHTPLGAGFTLQRTRRLLTADCDISGGVELKGPYYVVANFIRGL